MENSEEGDPEREDRCIITWPRSSSMLSMSIDGGHSTTGTRRRPIGSRPEHDEQLRERFERGATDAD
jgi:hypothetical protein